MEWKGKTLEKRTTYFINISGRILEGSSSFGKVKVGDQVTGVTNQYGYLEMLKNKETGKVYGLFSIWPMVIALVVTVATNIFFFFLVLLYQDKRTYNLFCVLNL
ncbi:MAG: hypothetical protein IPG07_05800 [Crocinitomicaceae bacterium]|nr:hypothetical protein [Crocinitomicaceae bacterium]